MLCLHTKEESRGKVFICQNAGNKCWVVDVLNDVVAVDITDEPPDDTKHQPGDEKAGNKCKESVAPLHVHHRGENILAENNLSLAVSITELQHKEMFFAFASGYLFYYHVPDLFYKTDSYCSWKSVQLNDSLFLKATTY